jgi:hypothetical protein
MYNRAFMFGCSFTNYVWPTWADMLAHQVDFPAYNLGKGGIGNVGILHELVKADIKYKYTDNDLIIIMWSHWSREDRYFKNGWEAHGNVFSNPFYDSNFIKKYWSWENDIIKNSTSIILANKAYNISDQFSILNYGEKQYYDEMRTTTPLFEYYYEQLPKCKIFDLSKNTKFCGRLNDSHPDLLMHLNFYNENIAKIHGLELIKEDSEYHLEQNKISNHMFIEDQDKQLDKLMVYFKNKQHLFAKNGE